MFVIRDLRVVEAYRQDRLREAELDRLARLVKKNTVKKQSRLQERVASAIKFCAQVAGMLVPQDSTASEDHRQPIEILHKPAVGD